MNWKLCHIIWMTIGICFLETVNVHSTLYGDLRNSKDHAEFHMIFGNPVLTIGMGLDVRPLKTEINNLNSLERKIKNATAHNIRNESKGSKNYNKNHFQHQNKGDNPRLKRENFSRFFADNYKLCKQRPVFKKKRDANGVIRKLGILSNNTNLYPNFSLSVMPFTHLGRDRLVNDKCKTQIIKFFPKPVRNVYENKFDFNESHAQVPGNENPWELMSQDIYVVEEFLPFREKNEFGFKEMFNEDSKDIFDDIVSIFTMIPFSIFDTINSKTVGTEKSKVSEMKEYTERSEYDDFTESYRRLKRQPSPDADLNETSVSAENGGAITEKMLLHSNGINNTSTGNAKETSSITVLTKDTNGTTTSTISTSTNEIAITSTVIGIKTEDASKETKDTQSSKITAAAIIDKFTQNFESSNHTNETNILLINTTTADTNNSTNTSKIVFPSLRKTPEYDFGSILNNKFTEHIKLKEFDPLEENIDRYEDNVILLKNAILSETTKKPSEGERSVFLLVLGIVPGIIGLIIAVGVIGIWVIQKNSPWTDRTNTGNEPSTSTQAKPNVFSCDI